MPALQVFLKECGKSKGRCTTHKCVLSNSKYLVPNAAEDTLMTAIDANLKSGMEYHLLEHPSAIFKMFLNVDLMSADLLASSHVDEIMLHVTETLRRFYPPDACALVPDMFGGIVTYATPPVLCKNRDDFNNIVTRHPRFTGNETVTISQGRIKDIDQDIEWIGTPAFDGSFKCIVEGDVVTLLAVGGPSFRNPLLESPEYLLGLRVGPCPDGAVSVASEVQKEYSPFQYSSMTPLSFGENRYLINCHRDKRGLIRHGLHIIFPGIDVNVEQALFMREAMVERLYVELGTALAPEGWSTAIKNSVYSTGYGMRMYGANKVIQCPVCVGRRGSTSSEACDNFYCKGGVVDEGRPYKLHSVYVDGAPSAKHTDNFTSKPLHLIRQTSIRTIRTDPTPNWKCFNGCPQIGDMLKTTSKNGETIHQIKYSQAKFGDDVRVKMGTSNTVEITDPKVIAIFEKHIRQRFVRQFKSLRVVKVLKTDKGVYFIYVAGEGQHFCMNLKPPRDHERNTIYFQCTKDGICQRCRCAELTTAGRQKGVCKVYCSTIKGLNGDERAFLFSDAKVKVSSQTFTSLPAQTATQLTRTQVEPSRKRMCLE